MSVNIRMPSDSKDDIEGGSFTNQQLFTEGNEDNKDNDGFIYYEQTSEDIDKGEQDKKDDDLRMVKKGALVLVWKPEHWSSTGKLDVVVQSDCIIKGDGKESTTFGYGSSKTKYVKYEVAGLKDDDLIVVYKGGNSVYLKNGNEIFVHRGDVRKVKKKIKCQI